MRPFRSRRCYGAGEPLIYKAPTYGSSLKEHQHQEDQGLEKVTKVAFGAYSYFSHQIRREARPVSVLLLPLDGHCHVVANGELPIPGRKA